MIVLDCSAAIEAARGTEAGLAFRELILGEDAVIAPDLLRIEARNAFWKYVHAGLLGFEAAETYANAALALVDEFTPTEANVAESFAEAARLDHSVYDMLYFTLARRYRATLLTADKRLAALCAEQSVPCTQGTT